MAQKICSHIAPAAQLYDARGADRTAARSAKAVKRNIMRMKIGAQRNGFPGGVKRNSAVKPHDALFPLSAAKHNAASRGGHMSHSYPFQLLKQALYNLQVSRSALSLEVSFSVFGVYSKSLYVAFL